MPRLWISQACICSLAWWTAIPFWVCASGGISSNDFDSSAPVCPEIDVLYGGTASAPGFRWAAESGITTLGILPGGANVVSGTGFAARAWGSSIFSMCLRRNMCLKMALGENTKSSFQSQGMAPNSRMGVSFLMEEYFLQCQHLSGAEAARHAGGIQ